MNDTTPDTAATFRALLHRRSGSDRARMVSDMFEMARALVTANIKAQQPDIEEDDLRVAVFNRFYRNDFSAELLARIGERLRGR